MPWMIRAVVNVGVGLLFLFVLFVATLIFLWISERLLTRWRGPGFRNRNTL